MRLRRNSPTTFQRSRALHVGPTGVLLALLLVAPPAFGDPVSATEETAATKERQASPAAPEATAPDEAAAPGKERRLPPARTGSHVIETQGEELHFQVTAGSLTLQSEEQEPEAELAYVYYRLETEDAEKRPLTFALNGGPGAASAYLHLGVLGPWLLPMEGERIVPSQSIELVENADSWLAFTDLVFIDPVDTGFSRLLADSKSVRDRYLSVEGDIEALARFITRWLTEEGRLASPKYFVGESYGAFRGPLLAEALQTEQGVGLKGLILLSPVLDFGWWAQPDHSPMPFLSSLPSFAAAAMERRDAFSQAKLRAAEDYAAGDFVVDFLQGLQDEEALERLIAGVAEITGLPPNLVADHEGRLDMQAMIRELARDDNLIVSPYDTTITADAPLRGERRGRLPDPVLDAMTAPLTSAMLTHYRDTLEWLPERRYHLLNSDINRAWNWGEGRRQPESVGALRRALALDPELQLLVVHGYTDLVTPYFASELILRQLRPFNPPDRVRQATYRGGHMFYTRADSRRAFRDDALELYQNAQEAEPLGD